MLHRNPVETARPRLQWVAPVVVLAMGVLILRLYEVQVYEGEEHTNRLRSQTTVSVILPPARGSILDRNGIALAENKASFDIDVYLYQLIGHYKKSHKGKVPQYTPKRTMADGTVRVYPKRVDVAKIVKETTGDLFENLRIQPDFTATEIRRHNYQTPTLPFQLIRDLDFRSLSQFAEGDFTIPGVQETARPIRQYNFGALAPHILGYVGAPEQATDDQFQPTTVGKEGIERSFDSYLQGTHGGKILRKNNLGYIIGEEAVQPPKAGGMVYLTLDVRIQWIAENVMRQVGRGACVIIDPRNGDILAMVSVPNYDPNEFIPRIDSASWRRLNSDPTKPLYNRSITEYAAGSIYKPIVALAALTNPNINFTPQTIIDSPGAIYRAGRWWKDWSPNGQGAISLRRGMAMSCNTFFYQLGVMTGIESIVNTGHQLGLGEAQINTTGDTVLPGENTGVMPGPQWMAQREKNTLDRWRKKMKETGERLPRPATERWSEGHTINTSIGQGYVQVTPVQMAVLSATLANGGIVHYPRLVMGIADIVNGQPQPLKEYPVRERARLNISPQNMQALRDSLRAVVTEGTGRKAEVKEFPVAGKTGTAQFTTTIMNRTVKDLRAWFMGFAPYDQPRYAIAVVVEGGTSGGSSAGPIVSQIFEAIHKMEQGEIPTLAYLSPAVGHFSGVRFAAGGDADAPPPEIVNESTPSGPGTIRAARGIRARGVR